MKKDYLTLFARRKQRMRLCLMISLMALSSLVAVAQTVNYRCGATFFDSGGENGNYLETSGGGTTTTQIVVCPDNPDLQVVQIMFTRFDVAPKDTLFAYDGLAANAPRFTAVTSGSGSGPSVADSPGGGMVTATCENGGCIRLVFKQTKDGEKGAGWKAEVSCSRVTSSNIDAADPETIFILADCQTGLAEVPITAPTYMVCGQPVDLQPVPSCPSAIPPTAGLPSSVPGNGQTNGSVLVPVGVHTITYVGPNRSFPQRIRVAVEQMNCDDLVRVSLESNCYAILTPALLLEDFCEPTNNILKYEIGLLDENAAPKVGVTPQGYPIYDFSNIHCNTRLDVWIRRIYNYGFDINCDGVNDRIIDECHSQIVIDDKIAPVFTDGPDVTTIYCYDHENLLEKLNARVNGERVVGVTGGFIIGEVSGERIRIPGLTRIPGTDQYEEILENCHYDVEVTDWRAIQADCTVDNLGPYQCWNLDQLNLVNSTSSVFTFYERTLKVIDKCGNKDTYQQLIAVAQPDIVAPAPQFEVDCGVDINPNSLRAAWIDWVRAGRPAGDPRQFYASYIPNFDKTPLDLQTALAKYGIWLPVTTEAWLTDGSGDEIPAGLNHADCGYAISWEDSDEIKVCGGGYKVFRDWTIYNWCDGHLELIDIIPQVIKVGDSKPPVFTSTPTYTYQDNGEYQCWTAITFTKPNVVDDCGSQVAVTVELNGEMKQFQGNTLTFNHLQIGQTVHAIFRALDECGNSQELILEILVVDKVPPVAICESFRVVSLGLTCEVVIPAESFDDGSYDNCGAVSFMVARMDQDDDLDGLPEPEDFGPTVSFTPADVSSGTNNSTMVVFKVTDGNGNVNYCMSEVQLQDKLPPVCPPRAPQLVDCLSPLVDNLVAAKLAAAGPAQLSPLLEAGELGGVPLIIDNCSSGDANSGGLTMPVAVEVVAANFSKFDERTRMGLVTYTYQALDAAGNRSAPCTDTIIIRKYSDWRMKFPTDFEFYCEAPGTSIPQPVPLRNILTNNGCDLWGMDVEQEFFYAVPDACYKLIYTYKLINWCTWNPSNTETAIVERPANLILDLDERVVLAYTDSNYDDINEVDDRNDGDLYDTSSRTDDGDFVLIDRTDQPYNNIPTYELVSPFTGRTEQYVSAEKYGIIAYRQIIKVVDNTPPSIRVTGSTVFCGGSTNPGDDPCAAPVNLSFAVEDICSPNDALTISCQLRLFGSTSSIPDPFGQLIPQANGQYQISGSYPLNPNEPDSAQHIIVIIAEDGCGNSTSVEVPITVKDCKPPTAYCYSGLAVDLMPTGMVQLWASDFDAGSFDFCTPKEQLKLTFADPRIYPDSISRTFDCNNGEIGTVPVTLWVQDLAGNVSYCETYVVVQNNQPGTQCGGNANALIAGAVQTEMDFTVENVTVNLSGNMTGIVKTAVDGSFGFNSLEFGYDYTITPEKDDDPMNGITTLDLVILNKHVLGVKPLTSPYKIIAGDVNKSGAITTFDLVMLRKLVLQIDGDLGSNTSWRFIDRSYIFPNPENPWQEQFPEVISLNNLPENMMYADFVAVKIGDLNDSARPNSLLDPGGRSTVGEWTMQVEDKQLAGGQEVSVPFTTDDVAAIEGFQYTLQFDPTLLELVDIIPGVANESNFGLTFLDEGVITASWNHESEKAATGKTELFQLVVRAKQNVRLSDILRISSKYVMAEAYTTNQELLDVALDFGSGKVNAPAFELYQNKPNPFSERTVISFNLPEATTATLTVLDVTGKVIRRIRQEFNKGYNEVTLDLSDLPDTGLLYYKLQTSDYAATQRMIRVKR